MSEDRLPPHSLEAEAALLGSLLLDPAALAAVEERFGGDVPFYDPRHQLVWQALTGLHREGKPIDTITLKGRLQDHGHLEQAGGLAYVSSLPEATPTATNLGYYLTTVWDKYLARALITQSVDAVRDLYEWNGPTEAFWGRLARQREEIEAKTRRVTGTPRFLKPASDFGEEYFARYFGGGTETPGLPLPIDFKLRIRPGECTLMTGDDGSGKSTFLSYLALHLAQQGQKVCVASFEMPPAITLWLMTSQLLGNKHLPDSEAGRRQATRALAWLNQRVMFYDFLGIGDWRDLLDCWDYAAQHQGMSVGILDSVMRIGIPDDDYAQQGLAGAAFARFCQRRQVHGFLVIHENKGGDKGKARIRGSKLWTANVDNIVRVERNQTKGDKMSTLEARIASERGQKQPDLEAINEDESALAKLRTAWDTHIVLQKQRYPGSQQNASRYVFFDPQNFQFRLHDDDPAVNWLDRWTKSDHHETTTDLV